MSSLGLTETVRAAYSILHPVLNLSKLLKKDGNLPMADRITPGQIRAARALLNWSMVNLANAATVSVSTIKRAEDDGPLYATDRSIACIRDAFETNGVRFLPDNGNGPGLRYKAG